MNTAGLRSVWVGFSCLSMAAGLLTTSGCRQQTAPVETKGNGESAADDAGAGSPANVVVNPWASGVFVESVTVDGGSGGGPNCAAAGNPTLGLDGGASCTGALAQSTFTFGLCSCTTLQASNHLTTDGFDSTKGAPDGGAGGSVGANGNVSWSGAVNVGGSLLTRGNVTASQAAVVRQDLQLGGTLTSSASFTVDGNAQVVKTLPASARVLGTVTKVTSVAAPCNCTSEVPTASIIAAHRGTSNDDAVIGLSPNALTGNNPSRVDLPCGNYYLSQINAAQALTIAVHGHTALYVDGNVTVSGALAFQIDPTATLDLFVAGTFTASNSLALGSQSNPARCRMYVAGANIALSGSATLGCNIYAPSALFTLSNNVVAYGSIFANSIQASGNATVHYDTAVLNAGSECCTAASCDDGNPCTVDSCNGDGTCSHAAATNGTACAGANKCEQTYTCQSGACTGTNPVTCAASDSCHVAGTCNPTTGTCSTPIAANGTSCSDGNACTQSDSCQAGVCTGTNPVTCSASDSCHVAGTCNPTTGTCSAPIAANGTSCSDGNACTQSDSCQAGVCTGSNPVTCTASDACHVAGTCNPSTGTCSTPIAANGTSCSDGNACTQSDSCQAGVCTGTNPVTCSASDACHVAGTCNPTTGTCSSPIAANGTSCSDGNACTQSDSCQAGVCTGTNPVTCTASDACHVAGTCNPTTGTCSSPIAANGTSCSDGNACTQSDSCQAGVCTGTNPVTCSASDACHVAGTCNPTTGTCSSPIAANGTSCSDGNACTQTDSCQNGTCTGTNPVTCAASDACHVAGTCNPSTGTCSSPIAANGTSCSDGNACTQGDACQNGTCIGPTPVTCNAPGPCQTTGTCSPQTGCVYGQAPDGMACAGTDRCNQTYQCSRGGCVGTNPVVCTASDACHLAGSCNPTSGSCSNPAAADGTRCDDGSACTQSDACLGGTCTGSNPVTCAALDTCHVAGRCNPSTGACSNPTAPDGTTCGAGDGGAALACMAGACGAQTPCTSSQTLCKGVCVSAQSDALNCGACGHACARGDSCAAGACVSPALLHSCVQSGSTSVLVAGNLVTLYIPANSRQDGVMGVHRTALDGQTVVSAGTILTSNDVIACASNWVTGEVVCVSGGTDVYLIQGNTLTATLTDGANGGDFQSGGGFGTVGVTVDASTNTATLALGTKVNGIDQGGYQVLDLETNTFGAVVPAGLLPPVGQSRHPDNAGQGVGLATSENPSFDPFRQWMLSPNEGGDFQLVKMSPTPAVFDNFDLPPETISNGLVFNQEFDSAAEDCTTGIAVASDESNSPRLTLIDLSQAVFTPGSPNGTWTAPSSVQLFPSQADFTGLTVAPGSHLGLLTPADGGSGALPLIAFRLPSSAGSGTPALVDWALLGNLKAPNGSPFPYGGADPHPVTSYVSPAGRAMAVLPGLLLPPDLFGLVDLQALLDAPRLADGHTVDPSYDLLSNGVSRFVAPCSQFNTQTDPNNCGGCGNVCAAGANATAACVDSRCQVACAHGFANCGVSPSSSCSVNLETDAAHCGACGTSCAVPNSTGVCSRGACKLTCSAGFSDCDGVESNGCETQGACAPLTASASGPASVVVGASATYVATVQEPAAGRVLSYAWTVSSGPGAVAFSAPDAATTSAVFSAPGSYVLHFEVSDGFGAAVASVTVNAAFVNRPPVVTAGPDQSLTAPTSTTTLRASATDDGLPQGAVLSAAWSLVSGPAAVSLATPTLAGVSEPGPLTSATAVTFNYPGTYVFQIAVSDTNLVGTATETVTVAAPPAPGGGGAGPAAPSVAIGGVTDDAQVTQPSAILGTVSDGSWVLEQRFGGRDDVQTGWSVMASGTGAVGGTTIATFDPTLLRNGIYTLRLSAANSAGSTSTSVSLSVSGRMKVGDFTLTFSDLSTAVGNLPLTVNRIYDSRDKTLGDFGVGWKLGISDLTVTKSGKTGAFWNQQFIDLGLFAEFCLTPSQAASVAITFPSGRQYRFTPESSPQCQLDAAITAPDIVWVSTSDPNNPTIKLVAAGGTSVFASDVGNGVTELQDSNFTIWDPRQFTLTIEDGSVWQVDQDAGVSQVTDLNGNFVKITPGGILHSSGTQVTFARDAQGRITAITDPDGQTMSYAYDGSGDLATYTDRQSNVTQFAYDDRHDLLQIQDPLGRLPVRNVYDASGRLLSTTDAAGSTVHYDAALAANQERVTDRLGHVTLYTYDAFGDITKKVDASGAVWNYSIDQRGNVLTETDPLGHTKTTTYDGADNVLTQTDALGNVTTSTYGAYRQLLTQTDALGHVTTSTYDASANVVSTTDALGNLTRYTYDAEGNRLSEVDPLNGVTQYVYDGAGHALERVDAQGQVTSYQYDANGNKTDESFTHTNVDGSSGPVTTHTTYDALGHVLTVTKRGPGSPTGTRSTTYTASGKRSTSTDENGRVTRYVYDALDRLTTTIHPDGTSSSQSLDAENRVLSTTDEAGNTTAYAYDALGRRVRTTFADGSSTSTAYDGAGHAVQAVDELGHVTWMAYDAAGRLTSSTNALGATSRNVYDAAGNTVSRIDPLGHTESYAYDAGNRVVATTFADGRAESTAYDAAGRASVRTDTLGRSTLYAYDYLGHLVSVTDALGQLTQYSYDERGAKTAQVDARNDRTGFLYDSVTGVETGRFLPDGSIERRAVDAAGQVVLRTDFMGQTTSYAYDLRGRLLSRTYPDGSVVSFTYTPTGRRATMTDARGTTSYGYDSRDRVVQMTYPDGRALAYGYDAHGNRTSLTAKVGGTSLGTTTGYDAANRPNRITDPLARSFALAYDADGNRTQLQAPNTTSTTYAYDARNRLMSLSTVQGTSATPVLSVAYTLDDAGRRTQVTEGDGTVKAYAYDGIDRLTGETVTGALSYAKTFAYDPVGNRRTQTTTGAGAATVNYTYDTRDRLTSETGTSYAYDANGNVTSKSGEAAYAWDFENRLTGANMTGGAAVAHQYDTDGNRVQTSVTASGNTATTNMLVDTVAGLSQVVAETDGSGSLTALYIRNGDELLEVMRPVGGGTWTTRFVERDGLGSVRVLTDENGTTTDSRGYEAFGTKNTEAGSDPLTYGFAGESFQADSRLAYHRARWMDARVGRFAGMDRFPGDPQHPGTLHRYMYAGNDPPDRVDPSGNDDIGGVDADFGAGLSFGSLFNSLTGRHTLGQPYVDVRATSVALFWDHLFLIVGDEKNEESIFRGGPSASPLGSLTSPNGDNPPDPEDNYYGLIQVDSLLYVPGAIDWDPGAPSVEVISGPPAHAAEQCFINQMNEINSKSIPYLPWGPNSNTVVSTMLVRCGLPVVLPESVSVPGFNDPLL